MALYQGRDRAGWRDAAKAAAMMANVTARRKDGRAWQVADFDLSDGESSGSTASASDAEIKAVHQALGARTGRGKRR